MPIELKMPALSPTMEEGTLAKWLKKEGDAIEPGDIIAEIETDKATMEFESIDEGTLGKIMVAEGTENVAVGTVIAMLAGEGEESDAAPSPAPAAPEAETEMPAGEGKKVGQDDEDGSVTPAPPKREPKPIPPFRTAPIWPPSLSAKHCAMRWPRKCGATSACS